MPRFKIDARLVRQGMPQTNLQVEAFDASDPPTWRSEKVLSAPQLKALVDEVTRNGKLVLLVQRHVAIAFTPNQKIDDLTLLISEWNRDRTTAGGTLANPRFAGFKVKTNVLHRITVPLPQPKPGVLADKTLDTTLKVVTLVR